MNLRHLCQKLIQFTVDLQNIIGLLTVTNRFFAIHHNCLRNLLNLYTPSLYLLGIRISPVIDERDKFRAVVPEFSRFHYRLMKL